MKKYNPIRRLREDLGMNQVNFGRLIGKSLGTVRIYEGNLDSTPEEVLEIVRKIAAENGFVDIVMELRTNDWKARPKAQADRRTEEEQELYAMLNCVLASRNEKRISAVRTVLDEAASGKTETPSTLNAKSTIEPKVQDPLTSDFGVCNNASHRQWQQQIDTLVEILSASHPLARAALMSNLECFRIAVRDRRTIELAGLGETGSEAAKIHEMSGRISGGRGSAGMYGLTDSPRGAVLRDAERTLAAELSADDEVHPDVSAGDSRKGQSAGRGNRAGKLGGRG